MAQWVVQHQHNLIWTNEQPAITAVLYSLCVWWYSCSAGSISQQHITTKSCPLPIPLLARLLLLLL
jgi:hypothetical protein